MSDEPRFKVGDWVRGVNDFQLYEFEILEIALLWTKGENKYIYRIAYDEDTWWVRAKEISNVPLDQMHTVTTIGDKR